MSVKGYDIYHSERQRRYHSGIYQMPMSIGNPVAVKLHGAIETHHVPFKISCVNNSPEIPAPACPEKGMTFLSGFVGGQIPVNMGTHVMFTVMGEYVFANTAPGTIVSEMKVGVCPSEKSAVPVAVIKPEHFKDVVGGTGAQFQISFLQGVSQ